MKFSITDPAVSRLIVTGHPNHELAIFGFLQRTRPRLLFLTDGGSQARIDESQQALQSVGLLDDATFLGWSEQTLYDALLSGDMAVIGRLVTEVRRAMRACRLQQVVCESIELYNPLHDITLPIVMAAAAGLSEIEIVEFPLIAQVPAPDERYRVQRFPAGRHRVHLSLEGSELAAKLHARDHYFVSLRRTMSDVLDSVSAETAGVEFFAPATDELPIPGRDHALRYERRGRLLHDQGKVDEVITFSDHFVPVVQALRALRSESRRV
ncbi:MAG: hypothetical protein ACXVH7_06385 [Thermoanaerobaculia bacterium]